MSLKALLREWVPFAILASLFSLTLLVVVHHHVRREADDPQLQMAEDAARRISAGATVGSVIPLGDVDIVSSLASYLVVYDADGKPTAGNGQLDGALPSVPAGVLEYAREHGQHRVTWQPRSGVRSAIVVVPYTAGAVKGTVLAGRSLREIEQREIYALGIVLIGWLASLFGILGWFWILRRVP